ncbi:unnamed protein product [Mytilus edulis]|uniref:DZIP3-like HEPN domain-containing protein n=1 Tax=Mytilus edulis TaxID=6550 RepID=A0A8S3V9T2_MYTED|nr:unnamed protein product [Mytilus edulis]
MTNVSFDKRWECGLTKPECVTGSNNFSEEKIAEYYCETCTASHKSNDEWSDLQSQELCLYQNSDEASESYPQTEKNSKKQIISTKFTKEEINSAKMGMIVLNILADALYDLLKQDIPNLTKSRSSCDITYLYSEHRKVNKHIPSSSSHKRYPWGGEWKDIYVTDIAIGDDIERIRLTRNELQHSKEFKIDDIRFKELCDILIDLLKRFDQHIKPARLYTDRFTEILAKIIAEEEVKRVHQRLENEIKLGKFDFFGQMFIFLNYFIVS